MGAKMGSVNTRFVCCALVLLLATGAWAEKAAKKEAKAKEPKKTNTAGTQTEPEVLLPPHMSETALTSLGIRKEITALARGSSYTAIGKKCEGLKGEKEFVGKFKAGEYAVCAGSRPNDLTKVQTVKVSAMPNCALALAFFIFTFHVVLWGAENGGPVKALVASLGIMSLLAFLEAQDAEAFHMGASLVFLTVSVCRPSFATYFLLAFGLVMVEGYADLIPGCPYKSEIQHLLCSLCCWTSHMLSTMWAPVLSGLLLLSTTGNSYGIITFVISALFMNANQTTYAYYAAITGIWFSFLLLAMPTEGCVFSSQDDQDAEGSAEEGQAAAAAPAPAAAPASPQPEGAPPATQAPRGSAPQAPSADLSKRVAPPAEAFRRQSSGQSGGQSGSRQGGSGGGARATYVSGPAAGQAAASPAPSARGEVPVATPLPASGASGSGGSRGAKRPREGDADTPSKRPRQ